jgi:1,4-dihydroxy-2-naphthoyl-CoA hydrolase
MSVDLIGQMPYARRLGIQLNAASRECVEGELEWSHELCTAGNVLHGGVVMTLADSLGAICAYLNLPEGAHTATLESKTNFFHAVRGGRVTATARPLHVGRSSIVVQTEVDDAEGQRVALVIQTQAVLH